MSRTQRRRHTARADGDIRLDLDLGDVDARGLAVTGRVTHDDLMIQVEGDPPIMLAVERFEGEIERIWFPVPTQSAGAPPPVRSEWKQIDIKKTQQMRELIKITGRLEHLS